MRHRCREHGSVVNGVSWRNGVDENSDLFSVLLARIIYDSRREASETEALLGFCK